ncbi:hypothetical protein DTO027B5_1738 [Paecilomyces variotii]|nr:hypothetical protein DTO027B3_1280 [Paecilomyces variotii]KAJ9336423.1 hypothetical protein DTO027B5_1738 [Paecilomyces variotii]
MTTPAGYANGPFEPSSESGLTPSSLHVHDSYSLAQRVLFSNGVSGDTLDKGRSGTMSEQQMNFPSLFQPAAERPGLFVPYRWWEDEATTVLWTFDVQDIGRVIRYGLFHDPNFPRSVLQNRNSNTIDDFLIALLEPEDIPFIVNLSHIQKVEEILRRFKASKPALAPWGWFPVQAIYEANASSIATDIDAESHLLFKTISFEEWVRYSLGYSAPSVEWFLLQHTAFFIHLSNHLHAYPEEIEKYKDVEKHLRTRSPFAHRALVQCLLNFHEADQSNISFVDGPAFEFIAGPIQRIFKDHPPSLTSILKMLSVLAVRFQRTYIHTSKMNWMQNFDVSVPFVEDVFGSISPADLARTLTTSDELDFARLSRGDIINEGPTLKHLVARWHALATAVWECCLALPDLSSYIQDCIQVLDTLRNYNSATALIKGLRDYKIAGLQSSDVNLALDIVLFEQSLSPSLSYLLDASDNFAAYRRRVQEAPGIPFLLPHVRESRQRGESALDELSQGLQEIN